MDIAGLNASGRYIRFRANSSTSTIFASELEIFPRYFELLDLGANVGDRLFDPTARRTSYGYDSTGRLSTVVDKLEVAREDLQLAREDGAGAGVGPKADVAAAGVQAGDVHAVAVAALAHGGRGGTTRDKVHVVVAGEQLHRVRPEGPDRVFGPIAARTAAGGRRPRSAARSTRPFPTPSAATSQSSARTGSGSRTSRTSEPTKAASTSPRSNSSPPAIPSQKCPSLAINWSMVRPREFGSSSSRNPVSAISAASASRSRSRVSIVNGVWPSVSTIANAGRSRRVMTSRSSSNSAGESFFIALRRPPAG